MEIEGGTASTKTLSAAMFHQLSEKTSKKVEQTSALPSNNGQLLVDMQNVNVSYSDRKVGIPLVQDPVLILPPKVLKNIDWQIRQGERWHLQGANGSFSLIDTLRF
jgi:ABC-type molybdenum transport system ATPase subunit/photorepair protein PhrA